MWIVCELYGKIGNWWTKFRRTKLPKFGLGAANFVRWKILCAEILSDKVHWVSYQKSHICINPQFTRQTPKAPWILKKSTILRRTCPMTEVEKLPIQKGTQKEIEKTREYMTLVLSVKINLESYHWDRIFKSYCSTICVQWRADPCTVSAWSYGACSSHLSA